MFASWKEKIGIGKKKEEVLKAPVSGKTVAMKEVNDPTFSEEMLGKGIAILPSEGKIASPVDGTVDMVFDTKHAISMTSDSGIQILIHVGLDTVTLKGEPFKAHIESGQKVKTGDLLLEFDMEAIRSAGLETITPIVICNSDAYENMTAYTGKEVAAGEPILVLKK